MVLNSGASTDTAIVKFSGTGGKDIVNSGVTISAGNVLSTPGQLQSTIAIGTAPLIVTSTTQVANLYSSRSALSDTVTTNANLTGKITSVGNATSLGSFTSAELATALTDETGSGANVFGTSPTITSPSIVTPSRLDMKQDTYANLVTYASTAANGQLVFATDIKATYVVKDSALSAVGGGSGSGINYILNSGAEDGIGAWATYKNATGAATPDGTITGTANSTFAISTSTALRGTSNFLFTKNSGASRIGEGFYYPFTIDASDKGKILQCSFEYQISSGTYADDAMEFFIWDVTNSRLISPAPSKLKNSGIIEKFAIEFQTSIDSVSYRLFAHVGVTTNSANTLRFDNFNLGPQAKLYGSDSNTGHIGEIKPYAGSIVPDRFLATDGTAISRTTYAELFSAIGTTYGVGDGSTTFNLPNTKGIFLKGVGSQTISGIVHTGTLGTTENDQMQGHRHKYYAGNTGGGSLNLSPYVGGILQNQDLTATNGPVTDATTDGTNGTPRIGTETKPANVAVNYAIRYTGAIVSKILSSDADTRVVAASLNLGGTQAVANSSNVTINSGITTIFDTHAGFNVSGQYYVVPVAGIYRVKAAVLFASIAVSTAVSAVYMRILINGALISTEITPIGQTTAQYRNGNINSLVTVKAGDQISFQLYQDSNTTLTLAPSGYATIERLSGPAQIAASESVVAVYSDSSGQVYPASTTYNAVTFNTKEKDSHNAFNGATGVFTAPMSGQYSVTMSVSATNSLAAAGAYQDLNLNTNGISASINNRQNNIAASQLVTQMVTKTFSLLAGQTVTTSKGATYSVGTYAMSASGAWNSISIARVGNY